MDLLSEDAKMDLFSLGATVYKHVVSRTSTYNGLRWCVPVLSRVQDCRQGMPLVKKPIQDFVVLGFFEAPHSPSKPASKTSQKMRSNLGNAKAVLTCHDKNASKTHDTQQDMKAISKV